jgi:ADP-ribose diphosphatase
MARSLFSTRWIELLENERGHAFVRMGDGVLIVPITQKREVILLREYSVAYAKPMLLLPAGAVQDGEAHAVAVNRELQEEIGHKAAQVNYLGTVHPHSKYLHWEFRIYLAQDLSSSTLDGDESWPMMPVALPLRLVTKAIADGQIRDASVIAALYLAQNYIATTR